MPCRCLPACRRPRGVVIPTGFSRQTRRIRAGASGRLTRATSRDSLMSALSDVRTLTGRAGWFGGTRVWLARSALRRSSADQESATLFSASAPLIFEKGGLDVTHPVSSPWRGHPVVRQTTLLPGTWPLAWPRRRPHDDDCHNGDHEYAVDDSDRRRRVLNACIELGDFLERHESRRFACLLNDVLIRLECDTDRPQE